MYNRTVRVVALALAIVMLMSVSAFAAGTDISDNYASSSAIYSASETVIANASNQQAEIVRQLDRASTYLASDRRALLSADGFPVPAEAPAALAANRQALADLIAADGYTFTDYLKTLTVRIPQNYGMDYGTFNIARSTMQAALDAGFTDLVFQNDLFAVRLSLVEYLPQVPAGVTTLKYFVGETRTDVPQAALDIAKSLPILAFREYRDGAGVTGVNYTKNAVALIVNSAMYSVSGQVPTRNMFYKFNAADGTATAVSGYLYSNVSETASFAAEDGSYFLFLPNGTTGTTNPGTTNPGTTNPGTTNPGTTNPGTTNPGTTNPGTTDPGTTTPNPNLPQSGYLDVADEHWASESIRKLSERGIISGVGNDLFEPESFVTREQFAKLLAEGFGLEGLGALPFADVATGDWAYPYISAVYVNGIVRGVSSTQFGYGQQITRQDMAVMLYKAMLLKEEITAEEANAPFGDDSAIADYAREAVYAMRARGIINGMADGRFAPNEPATRAQAAKMLCAALGI